MSLEKKIAAIEESPTQWANPSPTKLDKKFNLDKKSNLVDIVKDVGRYLPVLGAQFFLAPAVAATTAITAAGFIIGGYFEARKNNKKYGWQRFKRDLYSGNLFGFIDYGLFAGIDYFARQIPYLAGTGILNKLAKLTFFETLVVPPAVAGYHALEYIRDEMGWKTFAKRILTLQWSNTTKEIYKGSIKGKIGKSLKDIYKFVPALHYVQLNYVPKLAEMIKLPATALQMAQSALVNNSISRYILGKQAQKKKSTENKTLNLNNYSLPNNQYKNEYKQAA